MKHSITCFFKFFVILIMTFSLYGCKNYDVEPFYDGIYTVKTINGIDDEDIFNQNTTIEISHELLSYEVDYRNDIGTWHHMSLYLSDDVYLMHYHLTWKDCYFENNGRFRMCIDFHDNEFEYTINGIYELFFERIQIFFYMENGEYLLSVEGKYKEKKFEIIFINSNFK